MHDLMDAKAAIVGKGKSPGKPDADRKHGHFLPIAVSFFQNTRNFPQFVRATQERQEAAICIKLINQLDARARI